MICSQTMAVMVMNDPAKKVAVTICPPAEQDAFFQEQQFDEALGIGTNPIRWWQGNTPSKEKSRRKDGAYGRAIIQDRLKKAETALEGHENKDEILKLLRGHREE